MQASQVPQVPQASPAEVAAFLAATSMSPEAARDAALEAMERALAQLIARKS